MARNKKSYSLTVEKNQVPQGAWLAYYFEQDDSLMQTPEFAAFTTAAAAKRHLASVVGRSRINWTDVDGDGMTLSAVVEIKVD